MARASTVETRRTESRTTGAESAAADPPSTAVPERGTALARRGTDVPRDVVFGLLSVSRRRRVLEFLDGNGGVATLAEAAEWVAAVENDVPVERLTSDQRKRVYVGLYQNHLPKLDDANVVDFDPARGTIELREGAEQLFPYLYFDPGDDEGTGSRRGPVDFDRLYALAVTLKNRIPL